MLDNIPEEWGPKFQYGGGAATRTHTGPNTIQFTAPAHMMLVMFTPQPGREIALDSDCPMVGMAPVGSFEIIPAQSELFASWGTEKQNLLIALGSDRLSSLAGMEFEDETFELQPTKLGHIDRKAYQLARYMRHEIENQDLAWLENLDALITNFGIHLLRNYSSLRSRPIHRYRGGLAPLVWRRVRDFIQSHLQENLTLEVLASVTELSPSHFARAFKQTSGQSPHQYVIECRLGHAGRLIVETDTPLESVARTAGFSSNSHMTASMKRAWSVTPTVLRNRE